MKIVGGHKIDLENALPTVRMTSTDVGNDGVDRKYGATVELLTREHFLNSLFFKSVNIFFYEKWI